MNKDPIDDKNYPNNKSKGLIELKKQVEERLVDWRYLFEIIWFNINHLLN